MFIVFNAMLLFNYIEKEGLVLFISCLFHDKYRVYSLKNTKIILIYALLLQFRNKK